MSNSSKGKRHRSAGNDLERLAAQLFREAGYPHVVTTRSESKSRDDQGIDLMNKNEADNGRLPFNVQCKCSVERPKYDMLLKRLGKREGVTNVILHKYVQSPGTEGKVFQFRGHFAIIDMKDFFAMIEELKILRDKVKDLEDNLKYASSELLKGGYQV